MRYLTSIVAIGTVMTTTVGWAGPEPGRPHVIELFTSQGCSSCPPADALLGELAARPDVIALAFHIDYWDSLGWRDRFSMPEATQRQGRYVNALNLSSAFTPQLVVDGQVSFVGSDRNRIGAALSRSAPTDDSVPIELSLIGDELRVALPDIRNRAHCDVTLAAYLPKTSTVIGRGENSGRTLVEYNVVTQLRHIGTWDAAHSEFKIRLDTLPTDATRVAILLQHDGQPIAGAATIAVR